MLIKSVRQKINHLFGEFEYNANKAPRDPGHTMGSPVVLATEPITCTLAEVNAGKIIIPEYKNAKLQILDFILKSTGAWAALDNIVIQDTNSSPVVYATLAQAQLTDGAILFPGETGVTMGAGSYGYLTKGKGLKIIKDGSNGTTATNVIIQVTYKYATSL